MIKTTAEQLRAKAEARIETLAKTWRFRTLGEQQAADEVTVSLIRELLATIAAAPSPPSETPEPYLRIEHARKQGEANGFQQGWHAAVKRLASGDAPADLAALVPDSLGNALARAQAAEASLAAIVAAPPSASGWQPIDALRAYGQAEADSALLEKRRDQYQFWQGWLAALNRIAPPGTAPEGATVVKTCFRCGHDRQMHRTPCGFRYCGCPQFFTSETDVALATERTMRAAWEKRAYQAERELAELQAKAAPEVSSPAPQRDVASEIVQAVAELPDRTSPDEWPEAMLVTAAELKAIVGAALAVPSQEK